MKTAGDQAAQEGAQDSARGWWQLEVKGRWRRKADKKCKADLYTSWIGREKGIVV